MTRNLSESKIRLLRERMSRHDEADRRRDAFFGAGPVHEGPARSSPLPPVREQREQPVSEADLIAALCEETEQGTASWGEPFDLSDAIAEVSTTRTPSVASPPELAAFAG